MRGRLKVAIEVARGLVIGGLLCYALYRIASVDSGIVFRYAGY